MNFTVKTHNIPRTYEALEQLAKDKSKQGITIRMFEEGESWHWQCNMAGIPGIIDSGSVNAPKPIAFAMAVRFI